MPVDTLHASPCSMGIEGLDDILGGGLPKRRLYLIQGDPGAGKTTLALQFLMEGARHGEPVLYVTLSETREELLGVADSHGWNLENVEIFELSSIDQFAADTGGTFFHPSEVELNQTTQTLISVAEQIAPRRLVLDSLSELRMLADTPLRYRRQIFQLKQHFADRDCTVLFLDDRTHASVDLQIETMAHGVISLQRVSPTYGIERRQLNIRKIRGLTYREGCHDFAIRRGGLVVFPRLVAAEHHQEFPLSSLPSGDPKLDDQLGGGLDRGTASMFLGPPGTGKSTLALTFCLAAAAQGEAAHYFLFDETIGNFLSRSRSLGLNLDAHLDSGNIRLEQIDPAEISPGEFASRIRKSIQVDRSQVVVIDSINGYLNSMPEERYLNLQLHELLSLLNQQGVVTILVLSQQGLIGPVQANVDLTYLADTMVLFRLFETGGLLRRAISVIKKRTGKHGRTIKEFHLTSGGVRVGETLKDFHGVLTGTPNWVPCESSQPPPNPEPSEHNPPC